MDKVEAIKRIKNHIRVHRIGEYPHILIGEALYMAISALEQDTVSVVRCKDCAIPHNKWTGCPKLNGLVPPPEHFCSYGERRTDG